MILIVSYDLKASMDYTAFYEALKRQGTSSWSHYLSSTWLLSTIRTPKEVVEAVKPLMGPSDFILVGQFGTDGYFGWLPPAAWEWLKQESQSSLASLAMLAALAGKSAEQHE